MALPPAVLTAIQVIGVVTSVVGAISQGKAAQAQANLQSGILQQQATRERQQAAADEDDFRRKQSRILAARRAVGGASGITPTGSSLLVAEDFAGEVELNALRIREGGELRATRAEQKATLQRFKGRAASRAGFFRGGSLLLTGAGKVFADKGFA